jgi:hypothetical protein
VVLRIKMTEMAEETPNSSDAALTKRHKQSASSAITAADELKALDTNGMMQP